MTDEKRRYIIKMEKDVTVQTMIKFCQGQNCTIDLKDSEEELIQLWAECKKEFGKITPLYRWMYVMLRSSNGNLYWDKDWIYEDFEYDEDQRKCICGQNIKNINWLKHIKNGNRICMDEKCIERMNNPVLTLKSALKTYKYFYDQSSDGDYRQCASCGQFRIPIDAPLVFRQCKRCFAQNLPMANYQVCLNCKHLYEITKISGKIGTNNIQLCSLCNKQQNLRPCQQCGHYKIFIDEPDWKMFCSSCYDFIKSTRTFRRCQACQQPTIPDSEPDFKKLCYTCYLQQK